MLNTFSTNYILIPGKKDIRVRIVHMRGNIYDASVNENKLHSAAIVEEEVDDDNG